jgi:calcineurin-like phosphoesterase family protein
VIWFTSDWHIAHKSILFYDNRPFKDVEEMNEEIFRRCNEVVMPEDTLIYGGDLAFDLRGDLQKIYYYRSRINCRTVKFVLGNDDKLIEKHRYQLVRDGVFNSITEVYTEVSTKPNVFVSHFAHRTWNKMQHGVYHLYCHSHGTLPEDPNSLSFDIGANTNNYYPYSFADVRARMSTKRFTPIDHHNHSTRE